eukprot:c19612_g1_i1 orf=169-345(-)
MLPKHSHMKGLGITKWSMLKMPEIISNFCSNTSQLRGMHQAYKCNQSDQLQEYWHLPL